MRKCTLLVLLSIVPLGGAFAQTPFPTIANGTLVVNGVYQNNVTPPVAHNYKIATLPANNSSGHDFLRILVTLNPSYSASKDSYIDATFANRGGFTYQYLLLGADVTTTTTLAAYQNSDSSVDIYIVFSGAQQYTMAGYTMIQNEQETVYTTPSDATPTGTKVFDASQSAYPPTISTSQFMGAASDTAAAPVYTWAGDTNTGMYSPAADAIGFTTNGTQRVQVDQNGLEVLSGSLTIGSTPLNFPTTPTGNATINQTSSTSLYRQSILDGAGRVNLYWNAYNDSGAVSNKYYVSNEPAVRWNIGGVGGAGGTAMYVAPPTGTAGSPINWNTVFSSDNSANVSLANSAMTLKAGGNVGIGTTSPGTLLEVNGIAKIDSTLQVSSSGISFPGNSTAQTMPWTGVLCGGDYAEAVDTARDKDAYEPGDVLVITENDLADVRKSAEAYSTMVAGIFATKPGVIGRRQTLPKDGDEVPMAMVGIVPTKVTAENGPIHRGDLLVTSSRPGYAMKGTDRARMLGAVIGKAMGSLNAGDGVIAILVTLQ